MKVGWDLSRSPPGVPFCPYTMFQNPVSWPSHKKCRKNTITQEVLVTQSSNIVHFNRHTQKPIGADLEAFANTFSLSNWWVFFQFFVKGSSGNSQNFIFCGFWLGKMHQNGLSGTYLGFEACQIQCHRIWVSVISGSWKITISGKNFTFCRFWLQKCIEMAWVAHI